MKLVKKDLNAQNEGSMTFLMEDPEDLWHIFNIINAGDRITMTSKRKVAQTTNTGTVTNTKMIVKLTIRVETIDWNGDVPAIRIKGVNTEESRFVKLGQYHTFQLSNDTYNVPFTIHKDKWESVHLDRVRIAVNPAASAQVAAIVLHEGLANLCFITSHMTIVKATIEANIPKKRPNAPSGHDKAVVRFYHAVIDAMRKHINLDVMKCVIIAGPRLTTEQFMKTLNALAVQHDWKDVLLQKSKFVCVHAASGHKHSLLQAMRDPAVASVIADTSALEETRTLERFFELLNTKPDQAYYGYNFVKLANKANAIETLMITDSLFRAPELATRQKYIALVDECKANGVDVKIFSTMHVSGERTYRQPTTTLNVLQLFVRCLCVRVHECVYVCLRSGYDSGRH